MQALPDDAMTAERTAKQKDRPAAIRVVLPFVFRHWLEQPARAAIVAGGLLGATAADLFMPVFSGHLVDALTRGADNDAAVGAAILLHATSFVPVVVLGLWFAVRDGLDLQGIKQMTDTSKPAEVKA